MLARAVPPRTPSQRSPCHPPHLPSPALKHALPLRLIPPLRPQIRLNLFRALPSAPPPSGDPDEEEQPFADPTWPHLNIVYELLLRLVSMVRLRPWMVVERGRGGG